MGYWPSKLQIFGLEKHLQGTVTLTSLLSDSQQPLIFKGSPLMEHNLYFDFPKRVPPARKDLSVCKTR